MKVEDSGPICKELGKERVYFSLQFIVHREGMLSARNMGQDLKQRPCRNIAYWLASQGFLGLLSSTPRTTCPEKAPPTVAWSLPHQSLIKAISPQACPRANLMETILQPRFSYSQITRAWVKLTKQNKNK